MRVEATADFYSNGIPIAPSNHDAPSVWPGGAPITDHLAHISTFPDAWPCFPPLMFREIRRTRAASQDTIQHLDTRQITIGITQPDEVEAAALWPEDKLWLTHKRY